MEQNKHFLPFSGAGVKSVLQKCRTLIAKRRQTKSHADGCMAWHILLFPAKHQCTCLSCKDEMTFQKVTVQFEQILGAHKETEEHVCQDSARMQTPLAAKLLSSWPLMLVSTV